MDGIGLSIFTRNHVHLPASVARIHGDEDPEAGLDDDVAPLEDNALIVSLQRLLDRHYLLAHHRQHLCVRDKHSIGTVLSTGVRLAADARKKRTTGR